MEAQTTNNLQVQVSAETLARIKTYSNAQQLVEEFVIDCPPMANAFDQMIRGLRAQLADVEAEEAKGLATIKPVEQWVRGLFRPTKLALTEAIAVGREKLKLYYQQEEARQEAERRKQAEAERAARQEAEAKAAAERARAEEIARQKHEAARQAEAERQRLEEAQRAAAEAIRRAKEEGDREAARAAAEQERAAKAEAARQAAAAAKAEEEARAALEAGAQRAQATLLDAALALTAAPINVVSKSTGVREKWEARLEDKPDAFLRVVQFVAANPGFINLLKLDQSAANTHAKATRGAMPIDGLIVEDVGSLVQRKRV